MATCTPRSTTWSASRSSLVSASATRCNDAPHRPRPGSTLSRPRPLMATYAIGDVQGCFASLKSLLELIAFDAQRDRLWFVGDLVNRGPDSLATLRFVKSLGQGAVCVLGNHDLHLVAVAAGCGGLREQDTLQATLDAPDAAELVDWLRTRPLMHAENGYAMVHAGLLPSWTVPLALELAHEVEQKLRAPNYESVLARMYGNEPDRWKDALRGDERR